MKQNIFFFIVIMLLTSCVDRNKDLVDIFPSASVAVVENKDLEIDSVRNPYMMECVQGKLFFSNMNQPKMISAFDVKSGKHLGEYINRGEGPDELLFISTMAAFDRQLALFDSERKRVYFYMIDSLDTYGNNTSQISLQNDSAVLISAFNCAPLTDKFLVATGLVRNHRMALLDEKGKILSGFGEYPGQQGDRKATDTENGFAYQSFMAYNRAQGVLAVGSCFGESVSFYDMHDFSSPSLIKEHIYAYPEYEDASNETSQGVAFKRGNIMGFIALKSSPEYCIGLYNGKPRTDMEYGGNMLLLFDWEGNPIKKILLDQMYENMTYDEINNEVILLGLNSETGDYKLAVVSIE